MSYSGKKSKSSGLRMLWIGGRKNHQKGTFSTMNKYSSHSFSKKKSSARDANFETTETPSPEGNLTSSIEFLKTDCGKMSQSAKTNPLNVDQATSSVSLSIVSPDVGASKNVTPELLVTRAEILDIENSAIHPNDFPRVPLHCKTDLLTSEVPFNSSTESTTSFSTSSPSACKDDADDCSFHASSPHKYGYRNYNNNDENINSIESIQKDQVDSNLDWIDEMVLQRNCKKTSKKNKHKKTKKALGDTEPYLIDNMKLYKDNSKTIDKDDKVVKCLYYSLMCCDCSIS